MNDCRCGWDVEYAQLCTRTPGVLHPTGGYLALCPPESDCTDAVAHRAANTGWHTASGGTVSSWYERHAAAVQQLPLFEVAA